MTRARRKSLVILAVDPGIDRVAAARFDTALMGTGRNFEAVARAYRGVEQLKTATGDDVLVRCALIGEWVTDQVIAAGAELVVIEVPAKHGAYAERRSRQQTKGNPAARGEAMLNRSIGAIAAGAAAAGAQVAELSAGRYGRQFWNKKNRHAAMNTAFGRLGLPPLKGNEDSRDAAFVGFFYLMLEGL